MLQREPKITEIVPISSDHMRLMSGAELETIMASLNNSKFKTSLGDIKETLDRVDLNG
jgi:hypothetical protein